MLHHAARDQPGTVHAAAAGSPHGGEPPGVVSRQPCRPARLARFLAQRVQPRHVPSRHRQLSRPAAETVSRLISRFRELGIIEVDRRRVIILNREALNRKAGNTAQKSA
ncbi:MAG: helix-turn-helix domain-containing protein [Gammaproteobacteria bacterium]|nr:helix-turn-helix domain-containing protein [Gammaproteobacteria bacterium]